jgi:kumamolisin
MPSARAVGAVAPQERIEVSVLVRAKPGANDAQDALADTPPAQRHYLSREEFAAAHGADPQDLAKVVVFAQAHGLAVVDSSARRRTITLSGTAAQFEKAFDVHLQQYEHDAGTYRSRSGAISVPAELAGIVEGVFGLDNRPQARPHV